MPDDYEVRVGLNPKLNDSALDPDGDGLTNLEEYNAGTSPFERNDREDAHAESSLFIVATRTIIPDSDGDGVPDWWETLHGLDIGRNDAAEDPDGDSLTNLQEYNSGSDPQSSDSPQQSTGVSGLFVVNTSAFAFPVSQDSDGDGMPDWWEQEYGLNPSVDDSTDDLDGDGSSNLTEYLRGGDPAQSERDVEVAGTSAFFLLDTVGAPPDTDGDGMRDYWEIANGLDPFHKDAKEDPDGDGRTNLEEYNAGTNPCVDDWRGPSTAGCALFLVDTGGFNGSHTRDTDGDGMPDWWEVKYGLNPSLDDAAGDTDGDGTTNIAEYNAGTNPATYDGVPVYGTSGVFLVDTGGRAFDSDGDGLPDWWERLFFGDPRVAIASADSDADGVPNLAEFKAGSDPLDPSSVFRITDVQPMPATNGVVPVVVRWTSFPGALYSVWGAQFPEGPYSVLATNVLATPPVNTVTSVLSSPCGFFRTRVDYRSDSNPPSGSP